MNESADLVMNTLIGYRKQVQEITARHIEQECSIEIEKISKYIDNFITNYRQLNRAQRRFDKYLQGMNLSYSPDLRENVGLANFSSSTSFKDWNDLVSGCIGDTL
jgi:cytochrome c peroxidase